MTACSLSRPGTPFGFIFTLIVVFTLVALGIGFLSTPVATSAQYRILLDYEMTVQEIRVIEILSGHAWSRHGIQANAAFNCLGKNGSTKAFKTNGFTDRNGNVVPTNVWLCMDIDGKWFAVVTTYFEKVGADKVARLVTAYEVSKDLFSTIDEYIAYIGTKWGATAINYAISAGEILLQPK